MLASLSWLKEYVKAKGTPERIAEDLTMHAYESSVVDKKNEEVMLDVDVLPDRASDSLSVLGVAAEVSAIQNIPLRLPQIKLQERRDRTEEFLSVEVKEKNLCPRYMARVIRGVKVSPSPAWLKKRLENVGVKSINNVVDVTNFVMMEMGEPLHAFDGDKIDGKKIVVRKAKNSEKIKTLDDDTVKLTSQDLVIADKDKPIAIAGVVGGKESGVFGKTKDVILEAANFNPITVRKTALKHNIKTESSKRFEQGLSLVLPQKAIDRAAALIQDLAGGGILKGAVDIVSDKNISSPKMGYLDIKELNKLLGVAISLEEAKGILERLHFEDLKSKGDALSFTIPARRMDLEIQADFIEEVARIYGYGRIKPQASILASRLRPTDSSFGWQNLIKDYMGGFGYNEVYNYSLVSKKEAGIGRGKDVELQNPVSEERQFLRDNLVAGLLKNAKDNSKFQGNFKLFELGKIFLGDERKIPDEKLYLSGLMYNENNSSGNIFYGLKGDLEVLFERLGIVEQWYDTFKPVPKVMKLKYWDEARAAEIKIRGESVGFIGLADEELMKEYKLKGEVAIFELDFEKLISFLVAERVYFALPRYPAVTRDIAFLVDIDSRVSNLLSEMYNTGGKLVEDIDLFDIYEGSRARNGKKSIAFHIIYRSREKTLTEKEVNRIHIKIENVLKKKFGAEIR